MNLKSKKGFTLVELIIVIAILGIIALIAVPSLTGVQKNAQINADKRTAEQIGKAVRIWLTDSSDMSVINTRETAAKAAKKLSEVGADLDDYISVDYIPQAQSSMFYFVNLTDANKIQVSIGTAFDASQNYKLVDGKVQTGLAYEEGKSALN